MRRREKEMDRDFALKVLRDCEYATLGTVNENMEPYCIAISTVLNDNAVYFHCALSGEKLDNIHKNPKVCLSCVSYTKLVPEKLSTEYESAVVKGICTQVTDKQEKVLALRLICEKYAKSNMAGAEKSIEASIDKTGIYKIDIEEITGKANRY